VRVPSAKGDILKNESVWTIHRSNVMCLTRLP
jgi:hypothetical protein